jgi:hypothetical protein
MRIELNPVDFMSMNQRVDSIETCLGCRKAETFFPKNTFQGKRKHTSSRAKISMIDPNFLQIGSASQPAGHHCSWCTTPEGISVKLQVRF